MFLWHGRLMPQDHDIPVAWGDLAFTVHMALRKAEHLWPRRRRPGDHDRLKIVAEAVVDHIELCGIRCVRRPPGHGRSTPDPWDALPEPGRRDGGG